LNRAPVFLDSSFFIARLRENDRFHLSALEVHGLLRRERRVTAEVVLLEVMNFFSGFNQMFRDLSSSIVMEAFSEPAVIVEPVPRDLFLQAIRFFRDRPDKNYSLTDCISMLICRRLGIREIATTDHGFEQEGFEILLRSP
jgi:predicted nucleic acid-binding protein